MKRSRVYSKKQLQDLSAAGPLKVYREVTGTEVNFGHYRSVVHGALSEKKLAEILIWIKHRKIHPYFVYYILVHDPSLWKLYTQDERTRFVSILFGYMSEPFWLVTTNALCAKYTRRAIYQQSVFLEVERCAAAFPRVVPRVLDYTSIPRPEDWSPLQQGYPWAVIKRQCVTFYMVLRRLAVAMPKDLRHRMAQTIAMAQLFFWEALKTYTGNDGLRSLAQYQRDLKLYGLPNMHVRQDAMVCLTDHVSRIALFKYPIKDVVSRDQWTRDDWMREAFRTGDTRLLQKIHSTPLKGSCESVILDMVASFDELKPILVQCHDVMDLRAFLSALISHKPDWFAELAGSGILNETHLARIFPDALNFFSSDLVTAGSNNWMCLGVFPQGYERRVRGFADYYVQNYTNFVANAFFSWSPTKHAYMPPFFKRATVALLRCCKRLTPTLTEDVRILLIEQLACQTMLFYEARYYLLAAHRVSKTDALSFLRRKSSKLTRRDLLIFMAHKYVEETDGDVSCHSYFANLKKYRVAV